MRHTTRCTNALAGLVLAAWSTGCATPADPASPESSGSPAAGSVPLTPRAVAAVLAEHAPGATLSTPGSPGTIEAEGPSTPYADAFVSAQALYGVLDGTETHVTVTAAEGLPASRVECGGDLLGESCERLDDGVLLSWDDVEPEEDPGVVYVVAGNADRAVTLKMTGPSITGDPRDLDLPVPVAAMERVVTDPRLALLTTPEAVAAGESVAPWADEEPAPAW